MHRSSAAVVVSPRSLIVIARPNPSNPFWVWVVRNPPVDSAVRVRVSPVLTSRAVTPPPVAVGADAHGSLMVAPATGPPGPTVVTCSRTRPANHRSSVMLVPSEALIEAALRLPAGPARSPFMPWK